MRYIYYWFVCAFATQTLRRCCETEASVSTSDDGKFGAGKSFVLSFPSHLRNYNPRLLITTWSEQTVFVTISQIPGHTQSQEVSYGNFINIDFTPLTGNDGESFQSVALFVQATDYVFVYASAIAAILESSVPFSSKHHVMSDGFLAIPVEQMGTEYYVVSYMPGDWTSTFVVTALSEEVSVNIHFSGGSRGDKKFRLQPYESFYCMDDDNDMTGTLIQSDTPVSVISSHNCACIPNPEDDVCRIMESCAPLSEMMLPTSSGLGQTFVMASFPTYQFGFVIRVVGSETQTKINVRSNEGLDLHQTIHGPGLFLDFEVTSNTSSVVVTATQPVLLLQYPLGMDIDGKIGNTFMIVIPPIDQFAGKAIFPVYKGDDEVQSMVSITSRCDDQSGLKINSVSIYQVKDSFNMSMDDWCIFHCEVRPGEVHTVTHIEDDARFFVLVYGFLLGDYDGGIAYGYAAARGHYTPGPSTVVPFPTQTSHMTSTVTQITTSATTIGPTGISTVVPFPTQTSHMTSTVTQITMSATTIGPAGTRQDIILEIVIPSGAVLLLIVVIITMWCRYRTSCEAYERMVENTDETVSENEDDTRHASASNAPSDLPASTGLIGGSIAGPKPSVPAYKMDELPRGLCVIINNMNFRDPTWQRDGSAKDAGRLIKTFGSFQFKLVVKNDMTSVQMHTFLHKISQINHMPYDAFVCCILTHGQLKAELAGTDMTFIQIQHILDMFASDKCPSLAGKPKVFFIQACEGRHHQTTHSRIVPDGPGSTGPAVELDHRVPKRADFLLGYATVSGCYAYRDTQEGSWFINTLVEGLQKHKTEEIMTILAAVNKKMSQLQTKFEGNVCGQICAPVTTLTKKLYFSGLSTDETCVDDAVDGRNVAL